MALTVDNFFEGSGATAVKFPTVGTTVSGTIIGEMEMRQRTDIITGEPMVWSDGNPKMQLIIQLQTALKESEEDNGVRRLFVPTPGGLKTAIGNALLAARARGLKEGGKLTVTFSSETPSERAGLNPTKNYTAVYEAPAADSGFFTGATGSKPKAAAPADLPPGMDPAVWADLTPDVQAALKEAAGTSA
jgi:hypothetical protein